MNKIQSNSEKWIQKGKHIWIKASPTYPNPYQDAFLEGVIQDIQKKHVVAQLVQSKQQFKIPFQDCLKLTYGPNGVADMVDLQQLNQPELLYNIKRRYIDDQIFTYCGPTLLIINPYSKIQKLFNDTVMQQFQSLVFTDTLQYKNLAPHVFALAAFCLWQLFDNQRNQSIVISGQSGAGKTQNTKYCLKFLASLGKNMKQLVNDKKSRNQLNLRTAQKAIRKTNSKLLGIQDKILGCNQILQAFGNSKTIRNDNSSRFGKLILLVYGQTQIQIKSAFIISYLLQKSRIVTVSQGERNYHVFYYFCKGTTPQEKKRYFLHQNPSQYYYLNQSTVYDVPGASDEVKYEELKKQFQLYLTQGEIDCVLKILSVVLNLGNLKFKKGQTKSNQQIAIIQNMEYLQNICKLLQVQLTQLVHSFQYKTRKMGVSIINSPLKYDQALALRDSFSKNIYEKTFNFLIKKLNQKIQIQKINLEGGNNYRKSIGLLDIFGFQVLNTNSLQQFFINFANEKLQQLYVSYIFKEQQNEFMREGLKQFSHDIGFQDNKPIIDLFEMYPLGIFHLINQSSELNKSDQNLPESIKKNHQKNIFLSIPKSKRSFFQISHSCSPVSYNTNGFTSKNKDQFPQQLLEIISKTKNQEVIKIVVGQVKQQPKNRSASKKFLGSKFLNQMNSLIEELYSCDCHFVRCIKPNSKKSPKLFNSYAVLQSLRYLGVLDSIIIRKLGYIYRRPFKQFYKKFYELEYYSFSYSKDSQGFTEEDFKRQSLKIITKYASKQLQQKNILFGNKKILIKQSVLNQLQLLTKQKRKVRINAANRLKVVYKNSIFRTKVKEFLFKIKILKIHINFLVQDVREKILTQKIIKVQNIIKQFLWQKRLEKIKEQATKSVTKISSYWKMKKQRKIYLDIRQKSIKLQSIIRTFLSMGKFFRQKSCRALTIELYQKSWRIIQNKNALTIQKNWKGYKTRKQYKQVIATMKKNLKLSKIRVKFKRAIFQHNYNKFRQALNKYKKPIIMMQAIVRGRYLHKVYNRVKECTLLIQKTYRRHLKKKYYLDRVWKDYKKNISKSQILKQEQYSILGVKFEKGLKIKNINQTIALNVCFSPNQLVAKYNPQLLNQQLNQLKKNWNFNESIIFPDKNSFQIYIGDYDIISNQRYQGKWLSNYITLKGQIKKKGECLIYLTITQQHTTAVTNKDKVWRFSNSKLQKLQQTLKDQSIGIITKLQSIGENSYILNHQGKFYQWGAFKKNQQLAKSQVIQKLQFKTKGVHQIETKFNQSYCLNQEGKLFLIQRQNLLYSLVPTTILERSKISSIASSYKFVHFLTDQGTIFSKGSNLFGQLGLGFTSTIVQRPTLNIEMKNTKQFVQQVSVGMGHTLIKTKLGYAYLWGNNCFGQVSFLNQHFLSKPTLLQYQHKKLKVLQICAGLRASYFLLQNMKIVGMGTSSIFNSKMSKQLANISLIQETNMNSKNLAQIKIRSIWNRQQSILIVNAIDLSQCKQGSKPDAILKYSKSIAKEWINDTIYPAYYQWMDNYLKLGDMRKFKFKTTSPQKSIKKKTEKQSNIDQLKMLMQLRKTSTLFKQAAKNKIQQIILDLQEKKEENWTQQDRIINKYILENCKKVFK